MPGLTIIVMAVLVGFITGIFSRVQNQKIANGVVISIEHQYESGEKKPTYIAIVEYSVNGEDYLVKSGHKSASYYVGQKMRVGYDVENPKNALVKPTMINYIVFVLLLIMGIIVSIISFL